MPFESQWLNWRKEANQGQNGAQDSFVSIVSSSPKENLFKRTPKEEEEEDIKLHPSDKTRNSCFQSTDRTDRTPIKDRILDGHIVTRIIWETDQAVIFADDHSQFWRYLHVNQKAWPVVIEGGKL